MHDTAKTLVSDPGGVFALVEECTYPSIAVGWSVLNNATISGNEGLIPQSSLGGRDGFEFRLVIETGTGNAGSFSDALHCPPPLFEKPSPDFHFCYEQT